MSGVDRRDFLKGAGFATAAATMPTEATAGIARPPKEMPPQAVGHALRLDALHRLQGVRGGLQRRQQDAA